MGMKLHSIEKQYVGEYLSMYKLKYSDESGRVKDYEIVSKKGTLVNNTRLNKDNLGNSVNAVVLVVLNHDHSKILLNKEFRLGVNSYVYNLTAGLIDPGETPEQAAERELFEETGLKLTKIIYKLPKTYICAPVTDDVAHVIICEAEGDIADSTNPIEEIHCRWYTKQEILDLFNNADSGNNIGFAVSAQSYVYMWAMNGRI